MSLYVDDSAVKHIEEKIDQGLAVRVAEGNRPGQSSSSCSTMKEAEMTTMAAIRMAGLSPADSGFKQFPAGGMRSSVDPKVWDERIANMTGEQLVEISERIVESSTDGGGVKVPKGLIRVAKVESVIRNSDGVDVDRKNTLVYLNFTTMTDGSKPGEGVESFYSPHLSGLDPEAIGRSLREKALASSKTVAFKGRMKGNVIILPGELSEMLIHSAGSALSAENVHRKRSAWLRKVGEEVASRSITIVDDPSDGNGMLSSGYDDEGVPTSKKTLVDKGVLRSYLYDSYNAGLVSMEPSGNGVRRRPEDAQGIYLDPIGIWPMNLVLAPGRKGRADLISSVDEGVVIERVSDPEVNPITGAFGLEVRCGGLIRKGEVVQQIDRALLVGNMFEALRNVSDVASDSTVVKHCIVPTVCFDGIELIGGG
ncbi:MAG: TldD/PmbA family protein [Methanomassiliicoccales archaeon]|nr:TldD/PmbA family protein [Methanomassiliicoccales archaeon]